MAQFLPPPTYAEVILIDEFTKKATFNPIWLNWFLQVAQVLGVTAPGGTILHNSLPDLQGGTAGQFYHLTLALLNSIAGLTPLVVTVSEIQGADTAAANQLTLPSGGNYFHITGATQINLINNTGRLSGYRACLKFNSNPLVKNNQAASGTFRPIILQGGIDFLAAAGNIIDIRYDGVDNVWYELP